MKVTYIYPPLFKGFHPMATRMITENLLMDLNLDPEFSDIPLKAFASNVHEAVYERIMSQALGVFSPNILSFLRQKYIINNIFYVFMAHGYLDEFISDETDSPFVLFTCINFPDLIIVKRLLKLNRKVVLGGPLVNIGLSPDFFREFLARMGVETFHLSKDLIVVSGNIDLTTELHSILKNWKDALITHNNCSTIYECERDFLLDYYDNEPGKPVHFGFNNRCWYGKCKFCTYKKLPRMDFLEGIEDSKVIRNIHRVMHKFKSRQIRFIDSYYHAQRQSVQNILDELRDYHITIYSGIKLLKSKEYIKFVNKYVDCLLIGLESASDFTLRHIDKGYTYDDIKGAVDNIIKYLDKKIFLEISIILDLPCKDLADVRSNYQRIEEIKERLSNEGFKVAVHMNILSTFPNMELLYPQNGLLRPSKDAGNINVSSGKNYLIHLLREAGMDRSSLLPSQSLMLDNNSAGYEKYGFISQDIPIIRYDVHGNILPSDLNLMSESTMKNILFRRSKRSQDVKRTEILESPAHLFQGSNERRAL